MKSIQIRQMNIEDYDQVIQLWQNTEGIGLSSADSLENISSYLEHNLGCSFTAWEGDVLVGAVLCGHDYRRGYLHHLAVHKDYRWRGIGEALTERCLKRLKEAGIAKCHLIVFSDNTPARAFWSKVGWVERTELVLMSRSLV